MNTHLHFTEYVLLLNTHTRKKTNQYYVCCSFTSKVNTMAEALWYNCSS